MANSGAIHRFSYWNGGGYDEASSEHQLCKKIYKYTPGLMRRVSSKINPSDNQTLYQQKSWCITVCLGVVFLFHLLADWAFIKVHFDPQCTTCSCVFWFADVVGRHVALMAVCLTEPPVTVPIHVFKFQYPQPLISRDGQLVGTTSFEGVEGIVNLNGEELKQNQH